MKGNAVVRHDHVALKGGRCQNGIVPRLRMVAHPGGCSREHSKGPGGPSPGSFRVLRPGVFRPIMLSRLRTLPAGFIASCLPTKAHEPPSGLL
jgi:hypothetical protein